MAWGLVKFLWPNLGGSLEIGVISCSVLVFLFLGPGLGIKSGSRCFSLWRWSFYPAFRTREGLRGSL